MEQFNVMPPVDPNSNQPMHQPETVPQTPITPKPVTTPSPSIPPTTPPTPPLGAPPITPNINPQQPGRLKRLLSKFKLKYLLLIPIILILAVLIFGYFVVAKGQTRYGENMQDDLWQKLIDSSGDVTKDMDLKITYTDKGSYDFVPSKFIGQYASFFGTEEMEQIDNEYSFTIADLILSGKIHSYTDLSNKDIPKFDVQVDGGITNNQKALEASISAKLLEKEFYYKHDYNNTVDELLTKHNMHTQPESEKNIWIQEKDENSIKDLRETFREITELKTSDNEEDAEAYKKLLREHRLFDIKTLKGVSFRGGQPVLHYSLTLNKEKLGSLMNKSIDQAMPGDDELGIKDFTKEIYAVIIEKINVSDYEIWIGATNHKLYQSRMNIAALSVTKSLDAFEKIMNDPDNSLVKNIEESTELARAKARDAKRYSETRMMASALELYFDSNQTYPESKDGQPVGLAPEYIPQIPTAPTPADGDCDDWHNTYWYTKTSATTYTLTFCLGEQTAGAGAGNNTMSQSGIQSERSFDPNQLSPEVYYETNPDEYWESIKNNILETLRNLSFDANILIEYSAKDFGKVKEIPAPTDFKKQTDIYGDPGIEVSDDECQKMVESGLVARCD